MASVLKNITNSINVLTGKSKVLPIDVVIHTASINGVEYKNTINGTNATPLPYINRSSSDLFSRLNSLSKYAYNDYNCIDSSFFSEALEKCPPIGIILLKKSIAFTNGRLCITDRNGNEVNEKYRYSDLLKQPNPKQSDIQFRSEILFQTQLSRFCVVKLVKDAAGNIVQMYPLPSACISFEINKNVGVIIKKYKDLFTNVTYNDGNKKIVLGLEDIYIFTDNTPYADNLYLPNSRLNKVAINIDNIIKNLEARNSILSDRMSLGIFTNEGKDMTGTAQLMPMTRTEKNDEYNQFIQDNGLLRGRNFMFSENALKFQQIELDYNKLMMEEQFQSDFKLIADVLAYPFNLLAHGHNSSFNNMNEAQKALYENAIITESDCYSQQLADCLDAKNDKVNIIYKFDHLSCLQPDQKLESETFEKTVRASVELFTKNGCTYKAYLGFNKQDNTNASDKFFWQMDAAFQDSFLKNMGNSILNNKTT